MTPHDVIAAFETLAEAPEGVARLRELVFQLAVRGKLVPQDPDDEPASVLLDGRTLVPSDGERPFLLPDGWAWSTIRRLGRVLGGGTPSKRNSAYWGGDVPWVTPKDMKRDEIGESRDQLTESALANSSVKIIPPPALLMVVRGMILVHSFPTAITVADVTVNQDMKALVPFDDDLAPYLLVATKGLKPWALALVKRPTHGTCKLPTEDLFRLPLPVPPLAEQHRIVARVDELMGLLDRLEAAKTARDATRGALRAAALDALQNADTADEVEVAWSRIEERMDDLVCDPADVAPLRQTVLQLAVRGRLVPQDPSDEPASVLLERIATERARLVREKKIRKQKAVPPVERDEEPFGVPAGWLWTRLDRVCTHVVDCLHRTPTYVADGYPAVRTCDVLPGRVLLAQARRVDAATFAEQTQRLMPESGDVLYSREGGRYGIAAVVPPEAQLCLSQRMMQFRCAASMSPEYVSWFLNSPLGFGQAADDVGGSASPHVNIGAIRHFVLPLPPAGEQHRIVARVDELMGLLDRLEKRLTAARSTQAAFAAAAVHHLDA